MKSLFGGFACTALLRWVPMNNQAADSKKPFGRRDSHKIIIANGERVTSISLNPVVAAIAVSVLVFFGIAYLGATTYLFFRDDLIGATLARQARMQHAYEDRITTLRAEIDRITSRQLIDQEAFEAKLDRLLARQSTLDDRQVLVSQIIENARKNGIRLASTAIPSEKPSIGDAAEPTTTGGVGGKLEPTAPLKASSLFPIFGNKPDQPSAIRQKSPFERNLVTVETRIGTMMREHSAALDAISVSAEANIKRIEKVFGRLGVRLAKAPVKKTASGLGGPFVPLPAQRLQDRIDRAERALTRIRKLKNSAKVLPLRRPMKSSAITSRFGPRIDPFLRRPAMHTGIDFRGKRGTSVFATADGRVKSAGRNGGYGLSVEIDHGNGLLTRYAHLSRIHVKKGERIEAGRRIGRVGSTGRSTGPHLHYETHLRGKAIDPMRYLKAAKDLKGLL